MPNSPRIGPCSSRMLRNRLPLVQAMGTRGRRMLSACGDLRRAPTTARSSTKRSGLSRCAWSQSATTSPTSTSRASAASSPCRSQGAATGRSRRSGVRLAPRSLTSTRLRPFACATSGVRRSPEQRRYQQAAQSAKSEVSPIVVSETLSDPTSSSRARSGAYAGARCRRVSSRAGATDSSTSASPPRRSTAACASSTRCSRRLLLPI